MQTSQVGNQRGSRLLITGGAGFVLSNVIHEWLSGDESATAIAFDLPRAWDDAARAFLEEFISSGRLKFYAGSVVNEHDWSALRKETCFLEPFTHVVSGAALTPTTAEEAAGGGVASVMRVNLLGALHALEFARTYAPTCRFVLISSRAVSNYPRLITPRIEEEDMSTSIDAYALSKWTGEQLVARYTELYSMDCCCVRYSSVFGRMDRDTGAR